MYGDQHGSQYGPITAPSILGAVIGPYWTLLGEYWALLGEYWALLGEGFYGLWFSSIVIMGAVSCFVSQRSVQ